MQPSTQPRTLAKAGLDGLDCWRVSGKDITEQTMHSFLTDKSLRKRISIGGPFASSGC